MTLKPDPPPQVEVLRIGSGEATASRLFQLFATQALPAGSITTSVRICILPLRNTWMTSPGLVPAGWPFVSSPAISTTQRPNVVATQTSSLPSIDTPQGTSTTPSAVLGNAHDRANSPSPITRAVRNIRARACQWQGYPDSRAPLGRNH